MIERRDERLERLTSDSGEWAEAVADPHSLDTLFEAHDALRVLAGLPERQRNDLALLVAGYSYREIAKLSGAACVAAGC